MAFTRRYTDDQREAIYRLIHEDGKSPAEAVALAAEGVYGLEPFAMPVNSARPIARRIKLRREGGPTKLEDLPLPEAVELFVRRALSVLDRDLCSQEEEFLETGDIDLERLRRSIRCQAELADLIKVARAKGLMPPERNGAGEQSSSEFLKRLLATHSEGASQK
jgi:hypothetical protein